MKEYQVALITGLIWLVLGLLLIPVIEIFYGIRILCILVLIGAILFIVYGIILRIGLIIPHIYRFIHLYNFADNDDYETCIVNRLKKSDITRLKRLTGFYNLGEIFKSDPVLMTENITWETINDKIYVRVKGWVYATDTTEAKKLILNKQFGKWTDNTPVTPSTK